MATSSLRHNRKTFVNQNNDTLWSKNDPSNTDAYSEPYQTSKIECFGKIINS